MSILANNTRKARKGLMDLNSIILAIGVSAILTAGAFSDGFGVLDYFRENADGNRIQVIANALVSDINRNSDITVECSDGTNGCIVSDGGQYDGCSLSGATFSHYYTSGDSLANVELSSSGAVTNVDSFMYVICPK